MNRVGQTIVDGLINPLLEDRAMKVKIKKVSEHGVMPEYASEGAACFDLFAAHADVIRYGEMKAIGTGMAFEVPEGHVMLLFSRSGHAAKHSIRLANCVGVIDSDYRGEVKVMLFNDKNEYYPCQSFFVGIGERVAQGMVLPVQRVAFEFGDLSDTKRGDGGFGSTGK